MSGKKDTSELSPNQKAFRRLKRNKPAVFGVFLIAFALVVAVLGYLITPDSTPNANDQVNELALKEPFFKIQMLKVRKNREFEKPFFLKTMLFGKPNPYQLIPVNNFQINGDSAVVDIYQGKDRPGKRTAYHLVDIVFPLSVSDLQIQSQDGKYAFYTIDRNKESLSYEKTDSMIQSQLLTKLPDWDTQNIYSPWKEDSLLLERLPGASENLQWLKIRTNSISPENSENYSFLPFSRQSECGDSICLELLLDSLQKTAALHKVDIVRNLPGSYPGIEDTGSGYRFFDNSTTRKFADADSLIQVIESRQLYTHTYYFGTDAFGRDLLSRLMIGVRISLSVGLVAVLISLSIGILLGAVAGYFGGRTDDLIMLLINTMWSIPTLLLVFALVLALGRGFWQIFTAVGLTMWVDVARIVRGQVLSLKEIQYVEAARSFGFGTYRIITRHILPNIFGPVIVIAAANFAAAILIEAGLSYLGFGIQPPQPSWGTMLSENYSFLIQSSNPFPALVPGIAIMLMVLAFNLVGNGFRDALDVKTRK